jgi:branched-chain amino acid aminotransferase
MNECSGKKFILNGILQPTEMFDNSLVYEGDSVYEVLRIIRGNPVFFEDHMERMATSVKLQNRKFLTDISELRRAIITLTRSERKKESNIKIVFNYNLGIGNYLVYNIESAYPTNLQYKNGVKGILFYGERKDPESKVIDQKLRSAIYHKLIMNGAYEAILVNENNLITEGSRSNIFFVKGDILFTAQDSVILRGITRKHILEICSENKIHVDFSCVKVDSLPEYEAVFMTGTSPVVLPFNCIDDKVFNVTAPVIERLRKLYMQKALDSIGHFRSEL